MAVEDKYISYRIYLVAFVVFLMAIAITIKLTNIQWVHGDKYRKLAKDLTVKTFVIHANKGNIYSSDGSLLATSIPNYTIRFDAVVPKEEDFEKNKFLKVDYNGMYSELIKYGFEYAIVEYNAQQIKLVHKIHMESIPRFLISGHPKNKYDPGKLFDIWKAMIADKDKRNQEIMKATMNDFYNARGESNEKYVLLKGHIQRIQNNMKKYGGR